MTNTPYRIYPTGIEIPSSGKFPPILISLTPEEEGEGGQMSAISDISLDISPLDIENGWHQFGSVWEVLETYASGLVNNTESLAFLRDHLDRRLQDAVKNQDPVPTEITATDQQNFSALYESWSTWLKSHELEASLDCLKRIQEEYLQDEPSIHDIIPRMKQFTEVLEDELRRRIFLFVVPQDANLYRNPIASFPLTWSNYPSARDDVSEACRCYALGRYTACVFHCMAILQTGLYALAADTGAVLKYPVELAEWCAIIQAIEDRIKPLTNQPRSAARDDRMTFLSECAVQFRYFKDAWRNHVAHMRETYDRDQAHSILLHVRDFMEKLATRIPEVPSV